MGRADRWWSLLWLVGLCCASATASAATFYVDAARPDDSGDGTSLATAKRTISAGIALLASGDELVVADGVYTGAENRITDLPAGQPGAYTRVHAQNDWGATLSANTATPIDIGTESSYVEVRGFRVTDYEGQKVAVWADYVKVIRCAADGAGGNAASFCAYGNYILFEECHSWGGPNRYVFRTSHSLGDDKGDYVVFRRCLVRWDYSDTTEPISCFANYDTSHAYYQNCIAIDGTDNAAQSYTYDGLKGFFTPNGADDSHYQGCIVLNLEGAGYFLEGSPVANISLRDSIAWDIHAVAGRGYAAQLLRSRPGDGPFTVDGCLFGLSDLGLGLRMECSNDTMRNTIVYGVTLDDGNYAVYEDVDEDYDAFFGNTGDRNVAAGVGPNSRTDVDPLADGLRHLVRIEDGSTLASAGEGGQPIGPTILRRVGVSGTLYGEPGWDEVTDEPLWPWPNQDQIRDDCRSFHKAPDEAYPGSPEMEGARGFAADGTNLTQYIWEYLGNPMPPGLGGTGGVGGSGAAGTGGGGAGAAAGSAPIDPGGEGDDDGCGCTLPGERPSSRWPAAVLLLLWIGSARRRRHA